MTLPRNWGATAAERVARYPCDEHLLAPDDTWFRATDVNAPPAVVFRWLCQLRVAPYSYDKLDNFGRQSPQQLTAGREQLELGQRVMTIFELVSFERPHQMTIRMLDGPGLRMFGMFVLTYAVHEIHSERSRLVVKCLVKDSTPLLGQVRRRLLAWGDLLMMRRQLLNLSELAERTHAAAIGAA